MLLAGAPHPGEGHLEGRDLVAELVDQLLAAGAPHGEASDLQRDLASTKHCNRPRYTERVSVGRARRLGAIAPGVTGPG